MTIKEIQKHSLIILKDILQVSEEEGIKIYPAFGTLLGIARHNGKFIPWDDDIDVAIERKDIKDFFSSVEKKWPGKYIIKGAWEKGSKSTSSIIGKEINGKFISVDFFEILNIKDGISNRKFSLSIAKRYVRYSEGGGIQKLARVLLSIRSKEHYSNRMFNLLNKVTTYETTDRFMHFIDDDSMAIKSKQFFDIKKIRFEGLDWYSPKDPDNYLTSIYGDWNKIPSERQKQKAQHYDFEKE